MTGHLRRYRERQVDPKARDFGDRRPVPSAVFAPRLLGQRDVPGSRTDCKQRDVADHRARQGHFPSHRGIIFRG